MKMDLAKMHGCLAMSILPLLLLVNPTAACYCLGIPKWFDASYCRDGVVIEGFFLDVKIDQEDMTWAIYEFEVTDVLKGPATKGAKINLYSRLLGTTCGYRHSAPLADEKYVVTGNVFEGDILISKCSLIQPWRKLGVQQLRNARCDLHS